MKKVCLFLLVLFISFSLTACSVSTNTEPVITEAALKVHFVDVGQGDCIFIELPEQKCMLIDCGEYEYAALVTDYIKNLGYASIDYVVATHPHTDHMGGMSQILSKFKIHNFYMPEAVHSTDEFNKMLDAVEKSGCNAEYASSGKNIFEYNDTKAEFLAPRGKSHIDLNNASAIVKLVYKDSSFIFMGDAEGTSEEKIIASGFDVRADVLKCGHHGSSSSTTERFLNRVNPKYAVITSGKGNSYGHPHIETIALLEHYGIECYRTDELGTVIISTDGKNYALKNIKTKVSNNTEYKIFRTKKGKRYHRDGCDSLSYTKIPTTVEEAQKMGLTPCKACKP